MFKNLKKKKKQYFFQRCLKNLKKKKQYFFENTENVRHALRPVQCKENLSILTSFHRTQV